MTAVLVDPLQTLRARVSLLVALVRAVTRLMSDAFDTLSDHLPEYRGVHCTPRSVDKVRQRMLDNLLLTRSANSSS